MKNAFCVLIISILLTGCTASGSYPDSVIQQYLGVNPEKLRSITGKVLVAGSSTAAPLLKEIAEDFQKEGFQAQITIDAIGTDAGLQRFIRYGDTDLVLASRPITPEEIEASHETQRDIIAFTLAMDALTIAVPKENNFVENISTDELAKLFTTANLWSDINPAWPSKPIYRFVLGSNSGSSDYFAKTLLGGNKNLLLQAARTQVTEDDRILVHAVESTPGAVGFMGYPVWKASSNKLKALGVLGTPPNETSVKAGAYPFSRPLFLYTTASILKHNLPAAWVLGYLFQNYPQLIERSGFFPVSSYVLNQNYALWRKTLKEDS